MPESEYIFFILGVRFQVLCPRPVQAYFDAFLSCYDSNEPPLVGPDVKVLIRRDTPRAAPRSSQRVRVHSSPSQPYWNISGLAEDAEMGRSIILENGRVEAQIQYSPAQLNLLISCNVNLARAGELSFHFCRSIALYLRDGRNGNLLHASALSINGKSVLFMGRELSGKSTMFLIGLFEASAKPLASDRVLATSEAAPNGISWPGYTSFCEGTILDFPRLAQAAIEHEECSPGWQTQKWSRPLAAVYDKSRKRMYPMVWLSTILERPFRRADPIGAIVMPTVSAGTGPGLFRSELGNAETYFALSDALEENKFDNIEPAFLPWHGLARPMGCPNSRDLASRLIASGTSIWRVHVCPPDFGPAKELFAELGRAPKAEPK